MRIPHKAAIRVAEPETNSQNKVDSSILGFYEKEAKDNGQTLVRARICNPAFVEKASS